MSKKHYVVWKGAKTGIFDSWAEAKQQIDGRSDAQFMGFDSFDKAQAAFQQTYTKALMQRSLEKNGQTKAKTSPKAIETISTNEQAPIQIYCDGACSPNPGQAGTGIAVYQHNKLTELWYGLYDANGTNNSAELLGMLEAFKLASTLLKQQPKVQILSDSKYSIDCITKWAKGWKTKGWTRGKGEEIKNLPLIQECFSLYETLKHQLIISHVKGHANIEGNELADRMAVLARSEKQKGFVKKADNYDIATILAMPSG